jgi:membrane-bound lytic murein transglycosylase D
MKLLTLFIVLYATQSFGLVNSWKSSLPEDSQFESSSDSLSERVDFWVKIYSYYNTNQGVFHLVDDPSFILGEVDVSEILNSPVLSSRESLKQANKKIESTRNELLSKWKISDSRKVRLQMGLKDRMEKAFFVSGRYLPMMEKIFKNKSLPIELTRLVFVESSFNVHAQSKAGASGLWQIMPSVAKPYGYIRSNYDKRNHPTYATKLAADILEKNFKSLGSWPLAITAYNHGLTGVKRMIVRSSSERIEDLIDSEKPSATWGFASKNFYACFLAVLKVEKNALFLFGEDLVRSEKLNYKEVKLTRKVSREKILKLYNGSLTRFKQLNPHLNWTKIMKSKKIPAGIPLVVPAENFHLASAYSS